MLGMVADRFGAAGMDATEHGGVVGGAQYAQAVKGNLAALGIRLHNQTAARPGMGNGRHMNPTPKF